MPISPLSPKQDHAPTSIIHTKRVEYIHAEQFCVCGKKFVGKDINRGEAWAKVDTAMKNHIQTEKDILAASPKLGEGIE